MADLNGSLRVGFYTRLVGATNDFKTAITDANGTKLYYGIVPQVYPETSIDVQLPFVSFAFLPIETSRDSGDKFHSAVVQFNVAGKDVAECEDVVNKLTERLDDQEANLSFTGYETIRIEENPRIDQGLINNVWNMTVQYTIDIQES